MRRQLRTTSADVLNDAGVTLCERFERTGEIGAISRAIVVISLAIRAAPDDDPNLASYLANLGLAYRMRFERTSDAEDLIAAVRWGEAALTVAPDEDPGRARYFSSLSLAYLQRFESGGRREDLEAAAACGHRAVETADNGPKGDLDRAMFLSNLAVVFLRQSELTGETTDLDEVIRCTTAALAVVADDHPNHAPMLSNMAAAYLARFERSGTRVDLDEVIRCTTAALAMLTDDHPHRLPMLSNLAAAYMRRFELTGVAVDLDESIRCGATAAEATPESHASRAMILMTLASAYRARFESTGSGDNLDEAISWGTVALESGGASHPDYAKAAANLGLSYLRRFERLGMISDVDAAIHHSLSAANAVPERSPSRALMLSMVAAAHRARFLRAAEAEDLLAAVDSATTAVALSQPDHPSHPLVLSNLAAVHLTRFEQTRAVEDLDEAIRNGEAGAAAAPDGATSRASILSLLGGAYQTRAQETGAAEDLDAAVRHGTDAVEATSVDHPDHAMFLSNLAVAYFTRYEWTGSQSDLDSAVDRWRVAAESRAAAASLRVQAARMWGRAAAKAGDLASAVDGYATAVDLLPVLAWRGLGRGAREDHLSEMSGLACEAAAWAIEAGQLERAVELLEAGRSILWSQVLQTRSDLDRLHQEHPDVAARLVEIRTELEHHDGLSHLPLIGTQLQDAATLARLRRRLAGEWDELVEQVRTLDGFSQFLRPTPFSQLRQAGIAGAVVMVNVSLHRCDALLVADTGVRVCPLPDLVYDECIRWAEIHLSSHYPSHKADDAPDAFCDMSSRQSRDLLALNNEDRVSEQLEMLAWLWRTIVRPVLVDLGYVPSNLEVAPGRVRVPGVVSRLADQPTSGADLPRIWWCPTSVATVLPLHAAGAHRTLGGERLMTVAVSSYTPTLAALLRARELRQGGGVPRALAVGMPTTPPFGDVIFSDLNAVVDELIRVAACLPSVTQLCSSTSAETDASRWGRQPTCDLVLAEMREHAWVHLACHGDQDLFNPTRGAFYLTDGPLAVMRIVAEELPNADLAFLSACQTAIGGVRLLDEAIHLAAALQFAGYRHVIATMWSISDRHAPMIAERVYRRLAAQDVLSAKFSALAVHEAVAALYAAEPECPDLWAAYMHIGP